MSAVRSRGWRVGDGDVLEGVELGISCTFYNVDGKKEKKRERSILVC